MMQTRIFGTLVTLEMFNDYLKNPRWESLLYNCWNETPFGRLRQDRKPRPIKGYFNKYTTFPVGWTVGDEIERLRANATAQIK